MRYLYLFMFALFVSVALWYLVQGGGLGFIIIYIYAAFSSILAHYGTFQKLPLAGGAFVFLLYFYRIMPPLSQDWFAIEQGINAIGLLISALWLIALLIDSFIRDRNAAEEEPEEENS